MSELFGGDKGRMSGEEEECWAGFFAWWGRKEEECNAVQCNAWRLMRGEGKA